MESSEILIVERKWVELQAFLKTHGYLLRRRYQPGRKPAKKYNEKDETNLTVAQALPLPSKSRLTGPDRQQGMFLTQCGLLTGNAWCSNWWTATPGSCSRIPISCPSSLPGATSFLYLMYYCYPTPMRVSYWFYLCCRVPASWILIVDTKL
jgi:hypothetical protein